LDIKEEEAGGWRKLHSEELHNLYCSAGIIMVTKLRRMRLVGHVARRKKIYIYTYTKL
jgi:hypothetical protein